MTFTSPLAHLMGRLKRSLWLGSLLLLGLAACTDLTVRNVNDPDTARSLATADDVVALIGGAFNTWYYGNYNYYGAGLALSNGAFQHNAPWANSGMEKYGRLPRIAFVNSIADADYDYMTRSWFYSYRAIAAVADGLRSLADPDIASQLESDDLARTRAFGKFVQGMAHATIAVLFAEGFVVDENTARIDVGGRAVPFPGDPVPYEEVMDAAMTYFDDCIHLSDAGDWVLPEEWMTVPLNGPELAQVAHSMKARYAAAMARTPAERQALDWSEITADVDAGISVDFFLFMDNDNGWANDVMGYGTYFGWSQMAYFVYGMADQSGHFQAWDALPLSQKDPTLPDGDPVLLITPDRRFPRGTSVQEQRVLPGAYFRISGVSETGSTWARSDRGTWRWSWYKHTRGAGYWGFMDYFQPEIRMEEMRLLRAEGLYWEGDRAGAAAIVNQTRIRAGLSPTDATGVNTSCVPKLPGPEQGADTAPGNPECGGLFEMLKWEKRMENTFKGPMGNLWYFDGRGWGDLWKGTFLQLPIPCAEAGVLQLLPCQTFGGPGGEAAAPRSVYRWNEEG